MHLFFLDQSLIKYYTFLLRKELRSRNNYFLHILLFYPAKCIFVDDDFNTELWFNVRHRSLPIVCTAAAAYYSLDPY